MGPKELACPLHVHTAHSTLSGFESPVQDNTNERHGNRRPRVERLVFAWNRDIHKVADAEDGADDPLIGMSAEPSKRPRTRLTDKEVDAMRTARAQGVSVMGIAERFGVTRQTAWEKTR